MSEMMELIAASRRRCLSLLEHNRLSLLLAQDDNARHLKGLKDSICKRLSAPKQIPRLP